MISSSAPSETLLVLDSALNVRAANKAFYAMFRLAPAECVGRKVYELGGRAWDEKLRPMLESVLKGEPQSDHFELVHDDKEGGRGVRGWKRAWSHRRILMSTPFFSRSKI
jgi:two-component system CheB/CheR fusion protein